MGFRYIPSEPSDGKPCMDGNRNMDINTSNSMHTCMRVRVRARAIASHNVYHSNQTIGDITIVTNINKQGTQNVRQASIAQDMHTRT